MLELVIVVFIVALLASLAFLSVSNMRRKSRDAKRKADLERLDVALELFHDIHGVYPCGDANAIAHGGMVDSSLSAPFLDGVTPGNPPSRCTSAPNFGLFTAGFHPEAWSKDPLNRVPYSYWYTVDADRQMYVLYAPLENEAEAMRSDDGLCNNYLEIGNGAGVLVLDRLNVIGVPCN